MTGSQNKLFKAKIQARKTMYNISKKLTYRTTSFLRSNYNIILKIMRNNKTVTLFVLVLILALSSPNAAADMIPAGYKTVNSCYEISNINNYSDYVFLRYEMPLTSLQIINPGDCFNFYKYNKVYIYAIKISDFNAEILHATQKDVSSLPRPDIKNSIEKSQAISSNVILRDYEIVPENDPLEKVVTVLEIVSINENGFEIRRSKMIRTYTDGKSMEIQRPIKLDNIKPRITAVNLSAMTPITQAISITVNTSDDTDVVEVKANDIRLFNMMDFYGGNYGNGITNIWEGTIPAIIGFHSVNISARDEEGNVVWNN
jgi:hypothetical protein